MNTLIDIFPRMRELGRREAIRFDNGYRAERWSYRRLLSRIGAATKLLDQRELRRGDRLLVWLENSPDTVALFWGAVARGVAVVPLDRNFTSEFVERVAKKAQPKLAVVANDAGLLDHAPTVRVSELRAIPDIEQWSPSDVRPDDPVQVVFTSGTTSEPRGLVHRHANICANLTPIANEIRRYDWLTRWFQPIRILDLLPLSHLFGEALGVFVPPLLGGSVVFTPELHAGALIPLIRRHRVSLAVGVPALLENLRDEIDRRFEIGVPPRLGGGYGGILSAWWRYRRVHRALGWKFWAFIVGGARVDVELEHFWRRTGYAVVQGYGLTEASPVVAVNHPFHASPGTLGKPLPGQEIRLADDGEILVRGASVITETLGEPSGSVDDGGWLHTGDLGRWDEKGNLVFVGRKKDLIVLADGRNVVPADVEGALNAQDAIRECAVVGQPGERGEQLHAALVTGAGEEAVLAAVAAANATLEGYQRVARWTLWPDDALPRTAATGKIRRAAVRDRLFAENGGATADIAESKPTSVLAWVARVSGRPEAQITPTTRFEEELALGSLQRVELLAALEGHFGVVIDETAFAQAKDLAQLEQLVESSQPSKQQAVGASPARAPAREERLVNLPRWNRWPLIRALRFLFYEGFMRPIFFWRLPTTIEGAENVAQLQGPAIFVANHTSHLDTATVLTTLPSPRRYRIAPAMSQDFFRYYLLGQKTTWWNWFRDALGYWTAMALFQTYPLPQRMAGTRRALRYTGTLIDEGYSPLIFPEGIRSADGQMLPFQPGIGLLAQQLRVPVVPIHLRGMFEIYSQYMSWPKGGPVSVRIGKPITSFTGTEPDEMAAEIEQALRALGR